MDQPLANFILNRQAFVLLFSVIANLARADGVLISGGYGGIRQIDLTTGREQTWSLATTAFDPTFVDGAKIFAHPYPSRRIIEIDLATNSVRDVRSGKRPVYLRQAGKLVYLDSRENSRFEKLYANDASDLTGSGMELSAGPYEEVPPVIPLGSSRVAYVLSWPTRIKDSKWVEIYDFEAGKRIDTSALGQCVPYGWREKKQQMLCSKANQGKFQLAWINVYTGETEWVQPPSERYTAIRYVEELDVLYYLGRNFMLRAPENKE